MNGSRAAASRRHCERPAATLRSCPDLSEVGKLVCMERTLRVPATLIPDTELGGYVAHAVGVGVVSQGETTEEAMDNLREALELYFEDEDEQDLPVDKPALITSVDIRLSA